MKTTPSRIPTLAPSDCPAYSVESLVALHVGWPHRCRSPFSPGLTGRVCCVVWSVVCAMKEYESGHKGAFFEAGHALCCSPLPHDHPSPDVHRHFISSSYLIHSIDTSSWWRLSDGLSCSLVPCWHCNKVEVLLRKWVHTKNSHTHTQVCSSLFPPSFHPSQTLAFVQARPASTASVVSVPLYQSILCRALP